MNTQTDLSEIDSLKLQNIQLRQQILNSETKLFFNSVSERYGNPNELIALNTDGSLTRTQKEAEPTTDASPTPTDPVMDAARNKLHTLATAKSGG